MASVVAARQSCGDCGAGGDVLTSWAENLSGRAGKRGVLRFVFYGRVSTEDWQDPVTSRARQREQAEALVRGHGQIVAEHRAGAGWTLGTVTTILQNPRYTGRQVWNRQRTDTELADPGNVTLGHKSVQRWNLPGGWVISDRPAPPALVSEAGFIAAQDATAPAAEW